MRDLGVDGGILLLKFTLDKLDVDCIQLVMDRVHLRTLVNIVMKLGIQKRRGIY